MSLNYQHPDFPKHTAQNPALFSKCNVIWSEGWGSDALRHVASKELQEYQSELDKQYDHIIESVKIIHN